MHQAYRYIKDQVIGRGRPPTPYTRRDRCYLSLRILRLVANDVVDTVPYVSVSDVPLGVKDVSPRPLTLLEIKEYPAPYAQPSTDAIEAELHWCRSPWCQPLLLHQFFHDEAFDGMDEYGECRGPRVFCVSDR
ncbi:hypothetical protein R3P38DRAFT_829369 [Favolaschia claudopus]|uniref:Uncharacterized protein n=1 Tax=Favolaschia claudopus TaxID=2862362 RepID=A0AAW0BYN9_9AGAR